MANNLSSFCDDFYVDLCVNTELELPDERDTVLTFFERIQKQYPAMSNFYRRSENEYCLEENPSGGKYRWVTLETDRLACGYVNPFEFEQAYELHRLVLDLAPYMAIEYGVSRHHAALIPGEDALYVVDLDSTNGTWINGKYLEPGQRYMLTPGDRLELGLIRFEVRSLTQLNKPESSAD